MFWNRMPFPEFTAGTEQAEALKQKLAAAETTIRALPDDALGEFTAESATSMGAVQTSVSETRSRAAQLLAVTGFITLLAGLGTTPPSTAAGTALMICFGLPAVYALVGTMWLTISTIAVRTWDELVPAAQVNDTARAMRERYAVDLHRVRLKTRLRLEGPVGYLRDAYWFFFATVALLIVIAVLRFTPLVATAGSQSTGSGRAETCTSAAMCLQAPSPVTTPTRTPGASPTGAAH